MHTILRTKLFTKWLNGLRDRRAQTIIAARIERVSAGNLGDVKVLGGGLSELLIDYAAGYRVYFTARAAALILLLVGGDKSSLSRWRKHRRHPRRAFGSDEPQPGQQRYALLVPNI